EIFGRQRIEVPQRRGGVEWNQRVLREDGQFRTAPLLAGGQQIETRANRAGHRILSAGRLAAIEGGDAARVERPADVLERLRGALAPLDPLTHCPPRQRD